MFLHRVTAASVTIAQPHSTLTRGHHHEEHRPTCNASPASYHTINATGIPPHFTAGLESRMLWTKLEHLSARWALVPEKEVRLCANVSYFLSRCSL